MKRIFYTIWIMIAAMSSANSQDELVDFVQKADSYYHYWMADKEIKNFTFQLTSDRYINYVTAYGDSSHYYPIKVFWMPGIKPDYSLIILPEGPDSIRHQLRAQAQELRNLFNDLIFPDMFNYLVDSPMGGVPKNADAKFGQDTVSIAYIYTQGEQNVSIKHKYTKAGQLYMSEWVNMDRKVINNLLFRGVEEKWLCMGWQKQESIKDEVINGVVVQIEYQKKGEDKYIPIRMDIGAQQRDPVSGEISSGTYILFIRDFTFNANVQIITQNPDSTGSAAQ